MIVSHIEFFVLSVSFTAVKIHLLNDMKENVENLKGNSFSFLNMKMSSLYQWFFKIVLVIIFLYLSSF